MEETKTTETVQATEVKKEESKVYTSPYFMCSSDKIINIDMSIAFLDSLIGLLSKLPISEALGTVESLVRATQNKLAQEQSIPEINLPTKEEENAKAV